MTPPARRPIFIIGAMGSGTTLLRLMLDSHEHIAIPEETGFMRVYEAYRYTPWKFSGAKSMERLGWTPEALDAFLREHFHQLFMNYAEQHGKQRWGEKSPLHTWHVPAMARLFPDAQFVMTVRHPAASVHSNLRRFRRYENIPKQPLWHWNVYGRRIAQYGELLGDRMVLLRYEDLVLHSEAALRELLDWLGEPWSDAVLRHHEIQGDRAGDQSLSGQTKPDDPVDRSRIDRWKTTMPEDQQRAVARKLGDLGRFYGYDAEDPARLDALHESDRVLVGGAELAARIDRFPDLDLRREIASPAADSPLDPRKYRPMSREHYDRWKAKGPMGRGDERPAAAGKKKAAKAPPTVRRRALRLARRLRRR